MLTTDPEEIKMKGRIGLHRLTAGFTLACAIIASHYSYASSSPWQAGVLGLLAGWLCLIAIGRTVKASAYVAALVTVEAIETFERERGLSR